MPDFVTNDVTWNVRDHKPAIMARVMYLRDTKQIIAIELRSVEPPSDAFTVTIDPRGVLLTEHA